MTHPNPAFRWDDVAAMRAFVATRGFAMLAIGGPEGPMIAHAPVIVTDAGNLRFHLAKSNPLARHLEDAAAVASIVDADHYVSPDWYGSADQVPTWNYVAVEVEGRVRALDQAALIDQLDALSATFEQALAPKPVWTRAKMSAGRFEAMTGAILAFELVAGTWRGTRKLAQHKPVSDRIAVAEALAASGRVREAALVRPA